MKRILCISDIHGQNNKLLQLLEKVNYDPKEDQLILHGDYVDRGFDNVATLYTIKNLVNNGAIALKGNHDLLAEETLKELIRMDELTVNSWKIKNHIMCGGCNTVSEFKSLSYNQLTELYDFLNKLPLMYEINNYIFVHAGVDATVDITLNDKDDFLWIREQFINFPAYKNKTIIFGHTPTKNNDFKVWFDKKHNDKIGIDCGSIFGGNLACLELPSKTAYYV